MTESPSKLVLSASELRDVVRQIISSTIKTHRSSRSGSEEGYSQPQGDPTEDEINDFIACNPLYEIQTVEQLLDPGLLGFDYPKANLTKKSMVEFREQTASWAQTNEWLGADLVPYYSYVRTYEPNESKLWLPGNKVDKEWFSGAPSALLLAADLLRTGRPLFEMDWRSFEKLIGDLLEREGFKVEVTRGSKDGGIDVIASFRDGNIGLVRTIWQAKKYAPTNKVSLAEVRELSGLVAQPNVTKGVIATTSHLSRGALDWIRRDIYKLAYKDKEEIEAWIRRNA